MKTFFILLGLFVLVAGRAEPADVGQHWVGTWGTAPQLTEPRNLPPTPPHAPPPLPAGRCRTRWKNAHAFFPRPWKRGRLAAAYCWPGRAAAAGFAARSTAAQCPRCRPNAGRHQPVRRGPRPKRTNLKG